MPKSIPVIRFAPRISTVRVISWIVSIGLRTMVSTGGIVSGHSAFGSCGSHRTRYRPSGSARTCHAPVTSVATAYPNASEFPSLSTPSTMIVPPIVVSPRV